MADYKKYHHYSTVFVGREGDLNQINLHGLNIDLHKELKSNTARNFKEFSNLSNIDAQREFLSKNGPSVFEAIQDIVDKVDHDQDLIKYTLPLLDGILSDNRSNIQFIIRNITNNGDKTLILALNRILENTKHGITVHEAAAKVQAFIYSELDPRDYREKQIEFLRKLLSLRNQQQGNQNIKVGDYGFVAALVNILKVEHLVVHFLQAGGAQILASFLENNSGDLQISYYTLLNVWLISYVQEALEYFADPALGLIRLITEIIQKLSREKLVRVAFNTFRNLCEHQDSIELMVDAGLIKLIDVLLKGNIKDQDVLEDLKHVGEILEVNLKILSSFEKYQKEIHSKHLEWSPVHSEKFWRENIKKFEDDDFKMIKMLVSILKEGNNPKNQAIACYDLGQFCRFHPFGRNILEGQQGKSEIMLLAKSEDQTIRENALLALQKIMLHNWNIQVGK